MNAGENFYFSSAYHVRQNCETRLYFAQTVAIVMAPFTGENDKIFRDVTENNPISTDFSDSNFLTGQFWSRL